MLPKQQKNKNQSLSSLSCTHVQEQLWDYLDGNLSGVERTLVQTHLQGCAVCRQEWEQSRHTERLLATGRQSLPSPGDMRAEFYTRLATSQRRPHFWKGWYVAAPALAMGVFALILWRPATNLTGLPSHTESGIGTPQEGVSVAEVNTSSLLDGLKDMLSGIVTGQEKETHVAGARKPRTNLALRDQKSITFFKTPVSLKSKRGEMLVARLDMQASDQSTFGDSTRAFHWSAALAGDSPTLYEKITDADAMADKRDSESSDKNALGLKHELGTFGFQAGLESAGPEDRKWALSTLHASTLADSPKSLGIVLMSKAQNMPGKIKAASVALAEKDTEEDNFQVTNEESGITTGTHLAALEPDEDDVKVSRTEEE